MKNLGDIGTPIRRNPLSPSTILVGGFAATIAVGTAALMLPMMCAEGRIRFIDALFTATSAVCVTGLVVVDTGTYFTTFGQWAILILIQVGGLGIFTFSSFFMLILRGETSLRGRLVLQETMTHFPYRNLLTLLRNILLFTFGAEALGTFCLWLCFRDKLGATTALYYSIFHAVSAFCNAGFSLWANSIEAYRGNLAVCLTIMTLIIMGGLGFTVISEIGGRTLQRERPWRRLSLNSRVVISTTLALIVIGTLLFWILERNNMLAGRPLQEQALISIFQSVTARTAGFNTVDISGLTSATLFILVTLMFIGASPGSVGGGIKTSTFAVYLAMVSSYLRGKENVEMFGRTIPARVTSKAMATIATSFAVVLLSTILLQIAEGKHVDHAMHRYFLDFLFETVSAYGTVGLSTGMTPGLSDTSKAIIICTMFAGRVGPLGIALSLFGRQDTTRFKYPEENVMIG